MGDVTVRSGQETRREARVTPDKLLENLYRERDELIGEKRQLELQLRHIEDWRKEESSRILARRMPKHRSIEASNQLEVHVRAKKTPLMEAINAVEKRLHDIKYRLASKRSQQDKQPREDVAALLRVEALLQRVVQLMEARS